MDAKKKLKAFLGDHKDDLRLGTMDREIEAAPGTVSRIARNTQYRHFTDEQTEKLIKYLRKLHKEIGQFVNQF